MNECKVEGWMEFSHAMYMLEAVIKGMITILWEHVIGLKNQALHDKFKRLFIFSVDIFSLFAHLRGGKHFVCLFCAEVGL